MKSTTGILALSVLTAVNAFAAGTEDSSEKSFNLITESPEEEVAVMCMDLFKI